MAASQTAFDGAFQAVVAVEAVTVNADSSLPDRFLEVSAKIFSGAQPERKSQFAALRARGVRTVVSVDGAAPDVESASSFGLRYVHIPIGYDGISSQASRDLAAIVGQSGGSIFIHCHHGRHRGPAAAAIAAMSLGEIDNVQANQILDQAGTGQQYAGLWRDVANYKRPLKTPSTTGLLETAETSMLVRSMSQLGRSFESFNELQNRSKSLEHGPLDKSASHLAWLVKEGFNESMRSPEVTSNLELGRWMREAQRLSNEFRKAVDRHDQSGVIRLLNSLNESCVQCHRTYRN